MPDRNRCGCPPLPLETLYNARDLGGYPVAGGRATVCGRFVRTDAPVRLSDTGRLTLLAYPVSLVVDLRSRSEISHLPHQLKGQPGIVYHHIPLLGADLESDLARLQQQDVLNRLTLADLYRHMLDQSQAAIGAVMTVLAAETTGARLFNCSHGKDRTGLIAALLLGLAGVPQEQIVADYQISEVYLKPWFRQFIRQVPRHERHFFQTPARYMQDTLAYLTQRYRSAADYLSCCGVTPASQNQLVALLTEEAGRV